MNAVSAGQVNVPVVVRDDTGARSQPIQSPWPLTGTTLSRWGPTISGRSDIRGTIEFDTPAGAQIGALGIRIPTGAAHTYTTLPALAK